MTSKLDYGPHSQLIEAFFCALEKLTPAQVLQSIELRREPKEERTSAHNLALIRTVTGNRLEQRNLARQMLHHATLEPLVRLVIDVTLSSVRENPPHDAAEAAWEQLRTTADETVQWRAWEFVDLCLEAVGAIVVRDLIEPKIFDLLYGSFATLIPVQDLERSADPGQRTT